MADILLQHRFAQAGLRFVRSAQPSSATAFDVALRFPSLQRLSLRRKGWTDIGSTDDGLVGCLHKVQMHSLLCHFTMREAAMISDAGAGVATEVHVEFAAYLPLSCRRSSCVSWNCTGTLRAAAFQCRVGCSTRSAAALV